MLNILVIDNNPHFIHAFSYILEDTFKTDIKKLHVAESGNEALSIIGNNFDINVVFLDVDMPNNNGIKTANEILSLNEDLKVIALSFHEEQNFKSNFLTTQKIQYIMKENISSKVLHEIFDNI